MQSKWSIRTRAGVRKSSYILTGAIAAISASSAVQAANVVKADNADALNLGSSWLLGTAPGANDLAVWNSNVTAANSTVLGANQSWLGIQLTNPGGAVTIGAGNTLTLGTSGINMSAATQNLTVSSGLTLGTGGQTWETATGLTLAIGGTFSRSIGSTLTIDRSVNTGTVAFSPTLSNGIVGPWANVRNAGTAANNSANGYTYATVSSGNVAAYTGATAMTGTTAWGGIASGGAGVVNYDISSNGSLGATGLSRNVNTIRYTGSGATQPGNVSPSGNLLTANGIMNAGTGAFNIGGTGGTNNLPINITVGSNLELVLAPMSADLIIRGALLNGASASAVTVVGNNTANLSGVSAYTGVTTVAGGTLAVTGSGSINTTSGITISGANAKYLHTSSVAGNKPITLTRGILDGTGSVGAVTVGGGSGGVIANGNGGTTILTLSSLSLGGAATLNLNRASGAVALAVTGALSTTPANGQVLVNANGVWVNGLNNVISYGSFGGSASDFTVGLVNGLGARQLVSGIQTNGNNIALNILGDVPYWTGLVSNQWTTTAIGGAQNWKLESNNAGTEFLANDQVAFDDRGSANTAIQIDAASVSPASTTFAGSLNYNVSSAGAFGIASGSLTKTGTGTLTINTANAYSGGTTWNNGGLNVNTASAIGTGAVTINAGGIKSLDNTSGSAITYGSSPAQSWNDDFTFVGSNDLNLGSGNVTLAGGTRTVNVSAGTLTVGKLTNAAGGFVKNGNGTLQLNPSGTSSVTGDLVVNAGTLGIGAQDFTANGLSGNGTIVNGGNATRWVIITNATNNNFAGTLANGAGTGRLGFRKFGAGTMTLSGNNSYTDNTWIDAGTLVAGSSTALGNTDLVRFNASNTTLDLASDVASSWVPAVTFGTGTTVNIVSNRATLGAGINHTLTTQALNNGLGGGTINVTSGANVDQSQGLGRITFNQLGMGAGSVQTTLLNPTTANITIGTVSKQNNNVSQTLGLGGTSQDNYVTGTISNGPPLTGSNVVSVTKSNSSTWTLNGISTYTGATLVSGGKLTLANAASITSTSSVTVDSGAVLNNNGSITSAGAVTINGTLTGNGSITAATTVNGTLAPGNSAGLLTVSGSLTLADTAITSMEVDGAGTVRGADVGGNGYDAITVNGTPGSMTYDGTLNVDFVAGAPTAGSSFDFFDFAGSPGNDFNGINISYGGVLQGALAGSGTWTALLGGLGFEFTGADGVLSISAAAVPEPLTAAGVLLLAGRVLGRRNRASL